MSDQALRVSLVIPCRNEAARLPATLDAVRRYLDGGTPVSEVLIVVEKSGDETAALAEKAAAADPRIRAVINSAARGKGFAVKTGMLLAQGDIVFFTDADLSVPLRFIDQFLPYFAAADIVIASRRHPDTVIVRSQPFLRVFYGRMFNHGLRLFGLTSLRDTQCGFKGFRRGAAQAVFSRLTLDGFTFDVEALAIAESLGYRIVEGPVEWTDAPGSKVQALRDGTLGFFEAVLAAKQARGKN